MFVTTVRHDSSSRQFDNKTTVGAHLRLQAGSIFKELLYPIFKRETHLMSMADGTIVVVVYGNRLSTNDGDVRVASDTQHTHTLQLLLKPVKRVFQLHSYRLQVAMKGPGISTEFSTLIY